MLSYRLGMVNDFHWEFKPVLSYSKPYTFSTFFGEEKKRKNAFNLSTNVKSTIIGLRKSEISTIHAH